jgi:hypothetical protein
MADANLKITKTYREPTLNVDDMGYSGKEKTEGGLGKSNRTSMQGLFGKKDFGSPIYNQAEISVAGEADKLKMTPEGYRAWFFSNVVRGTVQGTNYGLGTYDLEFGENLADNDVNAAPNLSSVASGNGAGEPATPFVPNPASPGEGSLSPLDQAATPQAFIDKLSPNGAPFGGKNIEQARDLRAESKSNVNNSLPKV